ncbi:hypothetical protein ACHAQA_001686 [Verticillium albo-atrum]
MDASDETAAAASPPPQVMGEDQQPSKKRSREDSEEVASHPEVGSPEPDSKRQKTALPAAAEQAPDATHPSGDSVDEAVEPAVATQAAAEPEAAAAMETKGGKKRKSSKPRKAYTDEAGQKFWLPHDLSILHKTQPDETWEQRITRWVNLFVEMNADQKDLITPSLCGDAFAHNKGKRSKAQAHRVQKLEKAGKLNMMVGRALEAVAGQVTVAAGTSQDPVTVDDEDEDSEEEGEDTNSGNEDTDDTTGQTTSGAPSGAVSTSARSEQGDSKQQQASAPTASDWASLLGPEAENVPEQGSAQSKGKSTLQSQPDAAGFRTVIGESEAEREEERYFPGASGICTVCAATGHSSMACPNTLCQYCRGDHFSWNCPGRSRCAKCRQFGHTKSQCKEKLAMVLEEGLECAFCGLGDHLENACDSVWHSFTLVPENINTVRYIAAFCSYCGCEGHYSSDCPQADKQPFPQKWTATWSLRDRDLCMDANATDESIARFGVATNSNDPGMHIKGVAAKRTHIFYSDSDGSEEGEFIGEKVKPRTAPGQMRMSTNIQFNSVPPPAFAQQPPLPPGPPPSGPPPGNPGSYSRMAQNYGAPSHALPPRPPAPGQPPAAPGTGGQRGGYHNVPPPKGPATQPKNKAKGKNIPQSNKKRSTPQGSQQNFSTKPKPKPRKSNNNNNKKPRRGGKQQG